MANLPTYGGAPPMGQQNQMQTSQLIMSKPNESTKGITAILNLYKPATNAPNQKAPVTQAQPVQQPQQMQSQWGLPQYMS